MSDESNSPSASVIITLIVAAAIVGVIMCMSKCEVASVELRERTNQEAMKQGYVQGEYGRWRKP